jgi:hypothetical protein
MFSGWFKWAPLSMNGPKCRKRAVADYWGWCTQLGARRLDLGLTDRVWHEGLRRGGHGSSYYVTYTNPGGVRSRKRRSAGQMRRLDKCHAATLLPHKEHHDSWIFDRCSFLIAVKPVYHPPCQSV